MIEKPSIAEKILASLNSPLVSESIEAYRKRMDKEEEMYQKNKEFQKWKKEKQKQKLKSRLRKKFKYIYFLQCETGEIKIGIAYNVKKRISSIQLATPHKLTLLKKVKITDFIMEKKLHEMFKKHHKQGEWFYPAEEILNYIKNCTP